MIQEFGLLMNDLKNGAPLEFSSMHTRMCLFFLVISTDGNTELIQVI
jgi:hypothetical protein